MRLHILQAFLLLISIQAYSQLGSEGYYKDIFMDGGVDLYNKTELPAADALSLTFEYIATERTKRQNDRMIENNNDANGILLYPDGEPRFRLLHTNGGLATSHGNSLGDLGRENVRQFYNNGGSYTGVCAGAFIASKHYGTTGVNDAYYQIWPGRTKQTGVIDTYTGHFVETDSPLLQYYDFGTNQYIDEIYHTGGCYAREDDDFPVDTEILLRFDNPGEEMHQKVSNWAYKNNEESGRLVLIGSHPENANSGDNMELMKAIIQYGLAGQGTIDIKGNLEKGIIRHMNETTDENNPAYTKIGDKQYHHFSIDIPIENQQLSITLGAEEGYDFNIYLNKDEPAFKSNALFMDTINGSNKTLIADKLEIGKYYVSVECETTVDVIQLSWGFEYINNLDVLNGIGYSIQADYSPSSTDSFFSNNDALIYPNPVADLLNIKTERNIEYLLLTDMRGINLLDFENIPSKQNYQLDVSTLKAGIYILTIGNGKNVERKMVIKK